MNKKRSIAGFGALNVDLKYGVEKILLDGESAIKSYKRVSGGSARNTIYTVAMLGLPAGCVGMVGNDENGRFILQELESAGIDTRGIKILDGPTGTCLALESEGNRSMYVRPGVNDGLQPDDVDLKYVNGFSIVHFSSFLCTQGLGPLEAQTYVAESASQDVIRSLAPGGFYSRDIGLKKLERLLRRTNTLFLNRMEVGNLTGRDENDYKRGSEELLKILSDDNPLKLVVCTRGSGGVYARSLKEEYDIPGIDITTIDIDSGAEERKPPEAVGAGDKLTGAFWAVYLKKSEKLNVMTPEEYIDYCLRIANRLAAKGIMTGTYPTAEDLESVKE